MSTVRVRKYPYYAWHGKVGVNEPPPVMWFGTVETHQRHYSKIAYMIRIIQKHCAGTYPRTIRIGKPSFPYEKKELAGESQVVVS